jgi:hypothetical protein
MWREMNARLLILQSVPSYRYSFFAMHKYTVFKHDPCFRQPYCNNLTPWELRVFVRRQYSPSWLWVPQACRRSALVCWYTLRDGCGQEVLISRWKQCRRTAAHFLRTDLALTAVQKQVKSTDAVLRVYIDNVIRLFLYSQLRFQLLPPLSHIRLNTSPLLPSHDHKFLVRIRGLRNTNFKWCF